jgi:hypothetical protein
MTGTRLKLAATGTAGSFKIFQLDDSAVTRITTFFRVNSWGASFTAARGFFKGFRFYLAADEGEKR